MKVLDLFAGRGGWSKPPCNNGDPCHVRAPRGSRTGTQGNMTYHEKSLIPYQLALDVCVACEQALGEVQHGRQAG